MKILENSEKNSAKYNIYLFLPDIFDKVIGYCFANDTLQTTNAGQADTVSKLNVLVVTVAHRREFRYKEIVSSMVGRCVLFDVCETNKLGVNKD